MRIHCPNCQAGFDIALPKPGTYRPRCKQCGEPFAIVVSDDSPAKVRVGRVKSQPVAESPATGPQAANSAVVPEPKAPPAPRRDGQATVAANLEATVDSVPLASSRATMLEETALPSADLAQTMDSAVGSSTGGSIVIQSSAAAGSRPRANARVLRPTTGETGVSESETMDGRLGGYRLIRVLGRGAMGEVYEAKQVSLDRLVALKTIRDRLVNRPSALARFTREAYAAAQLNHHNVVQIYDFGEDAGQHFFSMEKVDGESLNDLVKSRGPIEARLAATYVVQAARGLQFAHRSGMVHRDVKPANLLLSRDGVVKVADLGLVKVPDQQDVAADGDSMSAAGRSGGSQVTMQGTTVGTPAYMAPEQSVDATQVDHRADIYSLGCTLFFLLAGKPPYDAPDVSTLVTQHAQAPIPDVRAAHPHIPPQLDQIIRRAMAKRPEDRYATLADMIRDLEDFLGVKSGDSFSPSVADADAWSELANHFVRGAPQARLRPLAVIGFLLWCGLLLILTPWLGLGWIMLGPACLLAGTLASLLLESTLGESSLGWAARRWCGSFSWIDWGYALGLAVLVLSVALLGGCWPGLVVGALIGIGLALGYHIGLRKPIATARKPILESADVMVRGFRLGGADEDGLRTFLARYSGKSWSDLFEALFGFDALIAMRERAKQDPAIRVPSLSLPQRVALSLNQRAQANREARDQQKLSQIEQRALVSEGVSEAEARQRAWQMAAAIMDASKLPPAEDAAAVAAQAKRNRIKAMMADARSGRYATPRDRFAWLKRLVGGQLRFAAGLALLAAVAMWAQRSGILDRQAIETVASQIQQGEVNLGEMKDTLHAGVQATDATEKVKSGSIAGIAIGSVALAGMMLLGSAFLRGWIVTPFAFAAAALAMLGPALGVPAVGPLAASWVAGAGGLMILCLGGLVSFVGRDNAQTL